MTLDARDDRDLRNARDVRNARDARNAGDARDARNARDARDLRSDRDARGPGIRATRNDAVRKSGSSDRRSAAIEVRRNESREADRDDDRASSLLTRLDGIRKAHRKAKAERAFAKQYGDDAAIGRGSGARHGSSGRASAQGASGSEGGARAAVYKGMMGRSQKRSQRLQSHGASTPSGKGLSGLVAALGIGGSRGGAASGKERGATRPSDGGRKAGIAFSVSPSAVLRRLAKPLVAVAIIAVICACLYEPAQQYYLQMRETQYLQAEYSAVASHNKELEDEIALLSTDEGVRDRAREELGYVMEDEHAGAVKGANIIAEEDRAGSDLMTYDVDVPQEWYSPMLDALFGWSGRI